MKTYKSFMTEEKGDTAIFTFGRFNPPTLGHEKLVIAVANVARREGGEYFVYPSHSQDPKKNPLDQTTTVKYMKKMFPKHKENIIISTGKTALEIASELHDKKYTNLVMVVGSDRVKEFQSMLDRYNGDENKAHGFYDFDTIKVVSAGERDPDAEGVAGMSASKMRESAVEGDFKTFRSGIPSSLNDKDTKKMFNDIRKGMRLSVVKEGSKWKNIDFTYELPEEKILNDEDQIMFESYTTKNVHTSNVAYDFFDELCNVMVTTNKKHRFYIKESLIITDRFLEIRKKVLQEQKINQYDFHELEFVGKKHFKLTENLDIDHLDNSFIYKYISEVKEYLEWGEPKSVKKYKKETPGQVVEGKIDKVIKWLAKKMDIAHHVAQKLVVKAQDKGIDPHKLQQKWAILSPTLISLVTEYKPKKQKPQGD
ncbi:hypothetical protein HX858_08960 [Marine Group I thaumarchaeote]|uniref:Cytidyltransferase-like domain-containing protein n=1 Tax=Marine Group I thaumarchaeote TaxID=2511932 RepID=A0A7K4MWH0_9ARCH|nr:hypothetical protein [Marine Group I thaumarchaeote]